MYTTKVLLFTYLLDEKGEYVPIGEGVKYAEIELEIEETEKSYFSSQGIKFEINPISFWRAIGNKIKKGKFTIKDTNTSLLQADKHIIDSLENSLKFSVDFEIVCIDGVGDDSHLQFVRKIKYFQQEI